MHGNGYSSQQNNFGIGLIGTPSSNVVEQNTITGNTNGIVIAAGARDNLVRDNTAIGNPAIQTANTTPTATAVDILNLSPAGATTFERNVCVTSTNAPCPTVAAPRPPQ